MARAGMQIATGRGAAEPVPRETEPQSAGPLWAALPVRLWVRRYPAGRALYHEHDEAVDCYVIRTGLVKLLAYMPNGRARIVRLLGPGDVVGLEGLLSPCYCHTAVTIEPLEAARVSTEALRRLRGTRPEVFARLLEEYYNQLRCADTWIVEFSTGEIRERVTRLLSFLAEIEHGEGSDRLRLLKCSEMAEVLGVTPESVSRVVAELKRNDELRPLDPQGHLYQRTEGHRDRGD